MIPGHCAKQTVHELVIFVRTILFRQFHRLVDGNAGLVLAAEQHLCNGQTQHGQADARQTLHGPVAQMSADLVIHLCGMVVISIQQQLAEAIKASKEWIEDALVISIAAGVRVKDLEAMIGHNCICRTMPNTPMKIGLGVCGLYSTPEAEPDHRFIVKVFAACGDLIWCTKEEELDGVTAISGSGPAYVFRFIEALTEAGLRYGFNDVQAKRMAIATVLGSAELAKRSGESPSVLREKVTSKGGTTYEALKVMNDRHFMEMMQDAMDACKKRAVELGDAFHESVEAAEK